MEAEPNFPPTSQRMVIALWSREEGSTHRSVPEWGKKSSNYENKAKWLQAGKITWRYKQSKVVKKGAR